MSGREYSPEGNLVFAFVSMIGSVICIGVPLTIAIIWLCS